MKRKERGKGAQKKQGSLRRRRQPKTQAQYSVPVVSCPIADNNPTPMITPAPADQVTAETHLVFGVDPGVAKCGIVGITWTNPEDLSTVQVIYAKTFATKPATRGGGAFNDAYLRSNAIVRDILSVITEYRPHKIAIEAFHDFPSQKGRGGRRRWYTPLMLGVLLSQLSNHDYVYPGNVVLQSPSVLRYFAQAAEFVANNSGSTIRSEHERSALAHALCCIVRQEEQDGGTDAAIGG